MFTFHFVFSCYIHVILSLLGWKHLQNWSADVLNRSRVTILYNFHPVKTRGVSAGALHSHFQIYFNIHPLKYIFTWSVVIVLNETMLLSHPECFCLCSFYVSDSKQIPAASVWQANQIRRYSIGTEKCLKVYRLLLLFFFGRRSLFPPDPHLCAQQISS